MSACDAPFVVLVDAIERIATSAFAFSMLSGIALLIWAVGTWRRKNG